MVARLWWVRHGPTHQTAFTGWRDVPADLSDDAALDRLAAYLPADGVVVSSDLSRAARTADRIANGRRRLAHLPALREINFGAWDGLTFQEVEARDPYLSRAFWEGAGDVGAPEGESLSDVGRRVSAAIEGLVADRPGVDLIAVAHMGVILSHLSAGAGVPADQVLSHRIDPLSVTRLDKSSSGWDVACVNHIA